MYLVLYTGEELIQALTLGRFPHPAYLWSLLVLSLPLPARACSPHNSVVRAILIPIQHHLSPWYFRLLKSSPNTDQSHPFNACSQKIIARQNRMEDKRRDGPLCVYYFCVAKTLENNLKRGDGSFGLPFQKALSLISWPRWLGRATGQRSRRQPVLFLLGDRKQKEGEKRAQGKTWFPMGQKRCPSF